MITTWNWSKFINVAQLKHALTSVEMATVFGLAADQILGWHDYKGRLVVSISGKGGRFVSYWQLSRAVKWLVQAIETCWDSATWFQLQKWIQAVWKRYKYSPEAKEQVEQALQQQQARLEDRAEAEDKANSFVTIIGDCREHKSLDLAGQLFYRQRSQFEKYPDLLERVMEAGLQQRAYLHSLKEQNQKAIAPPEAANQPQQDDPEDWNNKGLALLEEKKYEEALAAYDVALQLRPDFPEARNNLEGSRASLVRPYGTSIGIRAFSGK